MRDENDIHRHQAPFYYLILLFRSLLLYWQYIYVFHKADAEAGQFVNVFRCNSSRLWIGVYEIY